MTSMAIVPVAIEPKLRASGCMQTWPFILVVSGENLPPLCAKREKRSPCPGLSAGVLHAMQ